MHRIKFFLAAMLIVKCCVAQTATATPAQQPNAVATTPTLDETTVLKLQLIDSNMKLAKSQQGALESEFTRLRGEMQNLVIATEAKYPGYTINFQSMTLMAKPQMATTPKVEKMSAEDAAKKTATTPAGYKAPKNAQQVIVPTKPKN